MTFTGKQTRFDLNTTLDKANQIIGGYVPRTHDTVNHISISHCAKHVRIEDANKG